jgi:hypothetical protein
MRAKKLNILKAFTVFFFSLGLIGLFLSFSSFFYSRPWIESPNTERHGIALDSSGNIYCGSKCYGRIQKYLPNGRFIRGFNTEGGIWRGSDFGFRINENDQICITVSGMSKDYKGSVHRLRIYDQEGKLVHTERYETDNTHYWHDMKNSVIDTAGNRYIFKGFLFPRVVKRTPSGKKSIIISTPILLWFLQAPFPAFAFFFISMFIIIFWGYKADAAELSISTLDLIVEMMGFQSRRKFICIILGIIGIAVLLSVTILIGVKKYPFLLIFGFISLWIMLAIIFLLAFVCCVVSIWRCIKLDFKTWKNSMFGSPIKVKYEAGKKLRSLVEHDPVMQKMGKVSKKIVLLCFSIWFILLVIAICVVLYLDRIGVWHDLINN